MDVTNVQRMLVNILRNNFIKWFNIFACTLVKNHFNAKYVVNNFLRRYIASVIFELILIGSNSNAPCAIKSFQLRIIEETFR